MRKMEVGGDKNYNFKNGLAYTEDDILIYNIFVCNLPKKTTEEEVLIYFSSFGEVKSVHLVADKRKARKSKKIGFIHYTDATSAASALKNSTLHKLKSEPVLVLACNSWLQPFVSPPDESGSIADDESILERKSFKLTMLNDDCLEHIFKKLVLKDQVRFAMTCQRFKNIFEMVCKSEYKNHQLEDLKSLTLWEIREFFILFGTHIVTLLGVAPYKYRDRIIEFIGKFCPNIKSMKFNLNRFESSSFSKLLRKLRTCTVLELHNCYLDDHAIHALKKLPNLQSLSVAGNYELTGKYMNRLITVTDLVLYGCGNIQRNHFARVIRSLKDLKSLDIRLCGCLKASLRKMLNHSHRLESLKISCSFESYECIACLPSLKKIELLASATTISLRQQLFEELVEHKANQLESLEIATKNCVSIEQVRQIALLTNLKHLRCGNNKYLTDECLQKFTNLKNLEEIELKNCVSITNEGLLQLVQSCTNLKEVNIQLCTRITDPFVSKVIQVLKSTQNQRGKEVCLFYVASSGISSYMINNDEYIAAIGLLKLSFHVPATLELEGGEYLDDSDDDVCNEESYDTDYDEYVDYYDNYYGHYYDYSDYDD